MPRSWRTRVTWTLALLFVASAAFAAPVCRRECCRARPPAAGTAPAEAPAHDHCAPDPASAAPAHEDCGCHELGGSEAGAPTSPAAGTATGGADLPPLDVLETLASAAPRPAPSRCSSVPAVAPRHERAPPLYLRNASFLN